MSSGKNLLIQALSIDDNNNNNILIDQNLSIKDGLLQLNYFINEENKLLSLLNSKKNYQYDIDNLTNEINDLTKRKRKLEKEIQKKEGRLLGIRKKDLPELKQKLSSIENKINQLYSKKNQFESIQKDYDNSMKLLNNAKNGKVQYKKFVIQKGSINNMNLNSLNQNHNKLKSITQQLQNVKNKCNNALGLYQKSLQLQQRAGGTNVVGLVARNNNVERLTQLKRDKEMQAALVPAEKASEVVYDAFQDPVIEVIRQQYGVQNIGHVPKANLQIGKFGNFFFFTFFIFFLINIKIYY